MLLHTSTITRNSAQRNSDYLYDLGVRLSAALSSALKHAADTATTQVIVAPPGAGKTTQLIRMLSAHAGPFPRILWAVLQTGANAPQHDHETSSPPLAQEVVQAFADTAPGTGVHVLYGRARLTAAAYTTQFNWHGNGQQVRIISHAHLPWLFRPGPHTSAPHQFAQRATLLVIDEDPTGALLRSSQDLTLARPVLLRRWLALLAQAGAADPAHPQFKVLLRAADTLDGIDGVRTFGRPERPTGYGLTAAPFWSALLPILTPTPATWRGPLTDLMARRLALNTSPPARQQGRHVAELFMAAFLEDVQAATGPSVTARSSARIGAHRTPDGPARLRFNLRQPLALPCPAVILDAYANETQYHALLAERPPHFHHVPPAHARPLCVELAPRLAIHRLDLVKKAHRARQTGHDRLPERYVLVAQELHAIRAQQLARWRQRHARQADPAPDTDAPGLLLLTSRDFENDALWPALLDQAFGDHDRLFVNEGEHVYWYVGRGKNVWTGSDVIALNIPKLPATYAWYDMAALYPYDRDRRERLRDHLERSELLQMLGRGRQTRFPRSGPRVIVAADPVDLAWMLERSDVRVTEYTPRLHIQRHAKSALSHATLHGIVRELHAYAGVVPVLALTALRVISTHRTTRPPSEHEQQVLRILAKAGQARTKRPHLHDVLTTPIPEPLFKQVNLPRLDAMLAETLLELHLTRTTLLDQPVYVPSGRPDTLNRLDLRRILGALP